MDQLSKGSRVIVIGRTETDAWPDPQTGEKRTTTRVIVDRNGTIGRGLPSLNGGNHDDDGDQDDD